MLETRAHEGMEAVGQQETWSFRTAWTAKVRRTGTQVFPVTLQDAWRSDLVMGEAIQVRPSGQVNGPGPSHDGDGQFWQNGAESSTDSDRWRAQERRRAVHDDGK